MTAPEALRAILAAVPRGRLRGSLKVPASILEDVVAYYDAAANMDGPPKHPDRAPEDQ